MRKLLKLILSMTLVFSNLVISASFHSVSALAPIMDPVSDALLSTDVYVYDQTAANTADGRLPAVTPTYLIYPDGPVNMVQAGDLLDELGIVEHIDEYTTQAYVINPLGATYDNTDDLDEYLNVLEYLGIKGNVKVIGVGEGATFVNEVVSQNSWCLAGVMTYGGTADVASLPNSLPAYLHGTSATTQAAYIAGNNASETTDGVYVNPDNGLEKVVISPLSDGEETLAQAFSNAWTQIFSRNYRMYNYEEEWYTAGLVKYTTPFELVSYVNYDELGITVLNQTGLITDDATLAAPNQWYEYLPSNMAGAAEGSIPLLVTLHGNTNDNRMQAETSGWIEKAAQQGFMMIAAEHQASGNDIFGAGQYTALEEEGTIALVEKILSDYPQLDASRVYLCGLSMGAMRSYEWGIKHSELFAAVEGSSGFADLSYYEAAVASVEAGTDTETPVYMVAGTYDVYNALPATDAGFNIYHAMRAYGLLNGLDIPETPDLALNPYYGVAMDDQGWVSYNYTNGYTGTLSNEKGVMMKTVAMDPYAHWNNKQMVDDIWEFFSQYSKNPTTGVLTVGAEITIAQDLADDGKAVYGDYTIEEEMPGVYGIHDTGYSNPSSMYLMVSGDQALLFDGSNGTSPEQFTYILDQLVGDRTLEMVITHNHGDHLGMLANGTMDKDIKIYVPADDYNASTQATIEGNGYTNVELMDDQDVISCGEFSLTAQYLKGHTAGGMVFIEPNLELVISGDEVGSGYIWCMFIDDALTYYEQGLKDLIAATSSMENLVILPGHKWQTTSMTESGTEGPGELGAQYLQDMLKVLDGIYRGTANSIDYSHIATFFDDTVEVTVPGAKAAIDTRTSLIDQYLEGIDETNQEFLATLAADGSAVYGNYTVDKELDGVYHIHDTGTSNPSSMYLIVSGDEALLFDGSNGTMPIEFNRIIGSLIGDRTLEMAITHNHGDHLGMLLNENMDKEIKIYVPRDDYNESTKTMLENAGYSNIVLLDDQDVITCGDFSLVSQYLKGHTDGGMVFIDMDREVVFSGDEVGSGSVWIMFVDDALTKYEVGLKKLIDITKDMDNLLILPGHKWQTTNKSESGTEGPGVLGAQYLQDMLKVLEAIADGSAKYVDYSHIATFFDDTVEATTTGAKAAIDTRTSLVEQYLEGKKENETVVDTGDHTSMALYAGMALVALAGLYSLKKSKQTD